MSSLSKIPFRSPRPKPSVSVVMPVAAAPLAEVSTQSQLNIANRSALLRASVLYTSLVALKGLYFDCERGRNQDALLEGFSAVSERFVESVARLRDVGCLLHFGVVYPC